MSRAELKKK